MNHPSIAGHFPNNPIVPGALLIQKVIGIVEEESDRTVGEIRSAKFLAIVRPNQQCDVILNAKSDERWNIECFVEDTKVLVAELHLSAR